MKGGASWILRTVFPEGAPPPEPPPKGNGKAALLLAALLFAVVVALFLPATDHALFVVDDYGGTVNNGRVTEGITGRNVLRAFREVREGWQGGGGIYVPMVDLSYMVDVEISGVSPRAFHRTNVLLHGAAMAALLLLLWRATGAPWKSALAASLVALHPMRVEPVAWVAARKDVLCMLLLLLAASSHVRFARTRSVAAYASLLLFHAAALLSKPMAVVLPILLLLLDFWPLGRFHPAGGGEGPAWRRFASLAAEKAPLFLLSAAVSWLTWTLHAERSLHGGIGIASRLGHSFAADLYYLYETAWPADLVFRFYRPLWERFSDVLLPAAAGVGALTAACLYGAGKRPWLAVGWMWYLASLFPVSGISGPYGIQWIADRYTYLPHAGLAVALVWGAAAAAGRRSSLVLGAVAIVLLPLLSVLSRHQLAYWKDGATLLRKGLDASRDDPWYRNLYVRELIVRGNLAEARKEQEAILPAALDPMGGTDIQLQYLEILDRQGERKRAIAEARRFLAADPGFYLTRLRLAELLLGEGELPEAAEEFRRALAVPELNPSERERAGRGLAAATRVGGGRPLNSVGPQRAARPAPAATQGRRGGPPSPGRPPGG